MVCLASRLITVVICELRLYYVWPLAIESALRLSNEGSLFGSGEGKIGHKENTLNSLLEILCLLYRIGNLLYKSSLFQYKMSPRSQGTLQLLDEITPLISNMCAAYGYIMQRPHPAEYFRRSQFGELPGLRLGELKEVLCAVVFFI